MKSGILLQPPTTRAGCSWHLTSTILSLNERQLSSPFYWKDFGRSDTQHAWALLGSKGDQRCWGFPLIHFIEFSQLLDVSSSVQFSSVTQSCPTLCDPMNCSTPGLPVHHQLPEFTQTHVHWVSDAIQPSHPLSSPSPPAPNPSQHQSLFQWVSSSHEVAKVLDFQL